ncbi:HAD family hydrolase [Neomoorella mulderi]|uniref:Haloacid dehalogenase-like hydrolase n=1 Tax=Moorella mulderi DSM 14980 TaxID=1122241 RepID=A0A151AU33_9FIRM|nr:HAD family hydrolase [Moorella mulderi]KYH30927.1 haloacid dehalogenase-like hydrolase [Moorella mulderi DSM 14980]
MLIYEVPGRRIEIHQVVLDFNGTIACDGQLLPGVAERLQALASRLKVYILTADTFGTAAAACRHLPVVLTKVDSQAGGPDKERIITELGAEHTAAIGNGVNDAQMLSRAALGLLVLGPEGAAFQALQQADVVFTSILAALDFLLKPQRVVATLRP